LAAALRVGFAGTPPFAATALTAILGAGFRVVTVLTRPDRPRGRGLKLTPSAVKSLALERGLALLQPATLNDQAARAELAAAALDVLVVAAYGLILPRPVLAAPRHGCVNIHASLLPRWRGAAPIQRAILAGDEISGVTIMRMDEGLDTGPMLLRRELEIVGKNAGQVTEELAKLGAAALVEWLDQPMTPEAQPNVGVTYAPKVDKAEARIDWSKPAEEIERQVRAFNPVPGAWFEANGERIKLLEMAVGADASGNPGEVLDDCLTIACGEGHAGPLKVQRAGRAAMTPGELLRGFAIPKGTILP
jgi:methionyl-tRNA formyltransferase